ncbi:MAG: uroporphyrinogen-III C-methyltransferase, partial [Alphaproteobacteria bacterium]
MQVFLASIPLQNARVVVVGGGEPALAKLRLFLSSPADLSWFTPDGPPPHNEQSRNGPPPIVRGPVAEDFCNARLVFIAIEDDVEALRLAALARSAGALVNVVDKPALADFQTPAFVDRDSVVIGIATGGAAPILARDIRSKIEAIIPAATGPLARLAGDIRDTVKASVPDFLARRRFWERAFRGHAAD